MDVTSNQRLTIYYVNLGCGILSAFGCFFIIIVFFYYKQIQTFPFRLIVIMSFFDIFNIIGFSLPTYNSVSTDKMCIIQGILINFFTFCSII